MSNIDDVNKSIEENEKKESIGTQKEKSIHQFIKYYLSQNIMDHEVNINRYIIDVFINDHIYEIQTRNFNLLRGKLNRLLDKYPFTICYPIYRTKTIYRIDDEGVVEQIRKSPKKECIFSIGDELYKIKQYLINKNLSFKILILDIDEYAKLRITKRHQQRLTPIDKRVKDVVEVIDILSPIDWKKYLIDVPFTKKDFIKEYKVTQKEAGCMLNVLVYLGVIEIVGKDRNAYIYKKIM